MKNLGDIYQITYLCVNNPWRWKDNIENILSNSSKEIFFQIYREICFAYSIQFNVTEDDLKWYFKEIIDRRVIEPEIEVKKFGKRGKGIIDYFLENRGKMHNQNLDDVKKIYTLWKEVGIRKGFNISFYPEDLDEIFE